MAATEPFVQRVKSILIPELRNEGIIGRFPTFRRIRGELIHEVSVQGSRYGGERTVNLSFGFFFLQPAYAKPEAPETEYSYRIGTGSGRDRWWQYQGATEAEAIALADEMISVFRAEAPKFFQHFKNFPESFTDFTPDDFVEAPLSYLPPRVGGGRNVARDCWVFMRLWLHLNDEHRAKGFAKTGLQHVGKATTLEMDFRKILGLQ